MCCQIYLLHYTFLTTGWHASIRSERRIAARRDAQRSRERAALGQQRAPAPRRVLRVHAAGQDPCKIITTLITRRKYF